MAKTVLVVDDDRKIRRILHIGIRLNEGGVGIEEKFNGVDAVIYVAAVPPELVIMGIGMPVMDGIEATKNMRAAGYSGPIILHTGNDTLLDALRKNGTKATELVSSEYLLNRGGLKEILSKYLSN